VNTKINRNAVKEPHNLLYQYSVNANNLTNKIIDFTLAELTSMENSKAFILGSKSNTNNLTEESLSSGINVELTKKELNQEITVDNTQIQNDPFMKKLKRNCKFLFKAKQSNF
jgi:hypothetical protein